MGPGGSLAARKIRSSLANRSAAWAVPFEHRLPRAFQNVDMSRAMIVRIDHDPNSAEAQNRGHEAL